MPSIYYKRRSTIKKTHTHQQLLFSRGEKPKNRIVSTHKDYLSPTVRGKEIKSVEFGTKANKLQNRWHQFYTTSCLCNKTKFLT